MNDLNLRIAYNDKEATKESAREYLEELKGCYPSSLNLE